MRAGWNAPGGHGQLNGMLWDHCISTPRLVVPDGGFHTDEILQEVVEAGVPQLLHDHYFPAEEAQLMVGCVRRLIVHVCNVAIGR